MSLFVELGRTLQLDVLRVTSSGEQTSVLATGRPKDVRIDGGSGDVTENLFFTPRSSFRRGDVLELNVRDPETFETFPPGGIKLTVGRDMCNLTYARNLMAC